MQWIEEEVGIVEMEIVILFFLKIQIKQEVKKLREIQSLIEEYVQDWRVWNIFIYCKKGLVEEK